MKTSRERETDEEAAKAHRKKSPISGGRSAQRRSALMAARDLAACLDAIEAELRHYSPLDCYAINLYQPADNTLMCARLHLPSPYASIEDTFSQYSFPLENQDASTIAFQTGVTVKITEKNLKSFSERTQARFLHGNMRSFAVLPIQPNGPDKPATGTLVLISQQCVLSTAMLASVRKLLAEAAPILQLHQRSAALEARHYSIRIAENELQSLLHFIAEVNSLTTEEEIYPRIEHEFMARFDLDFAAVLIAEDGFLRCADSRFTPSDAPWGRAWREHCAKISYALDQRDAASSNAHINNRPFFFGDIPSVQKLPMGEQDRANLDILTDLQTFAIQPIRRHGKPVGILWLGSMRRQNALSKEQLALIQQLCDFLGSVIENARVYSLLSAHSSPGDIQGALESHDRLTTLHNHASFEIELVQRLQALHRQSRPRPVSLLLGNVDEFRLFNDTHGFVVGNAVLQEIARRLSETVAGEFTARFGGEFAILLNHCDLTMAAQRAEQIRQRVASKPIRFEGRDYRIAISFGCAELSPADNTARLLERIKRALLSAKASGRNRVVQAPNPT